ncbi:MAG: hypothetical protein MJB14_22890 [Spirochaetes bacterium]|nr:hypothetical protein [Spirochaetota bacterium]
MKKLIILLFILFLLICKSDNDQTDEQDPAQTETQTQQDETTDTVKVAEPVVNNKVDQRMVFELHENMDKNTLKKHMEDLFNAIEEKIARGDYEGWFSSVSQANRNKISDIDYLTFISKRAEFLLDRGIVLTKPEDFFYHIVVEGRKGVSLEFSGYEYINKKNVKVISLYQLDKTKKYVYDFIYEDDSWKLNLKL